MEDFQTIGAIVAIMLSLFYIYDEIMKRRGK